MDITRYRLGEVTPRMTAISHDVVRHVDGRCCIHPQYSTKYPRQMFCGLHSAGKPVSAVRHT